MRRPRAGPEQFRRSAAGSMRVTPVGRCGWRTCALVRPPTEASGGAFRRAAGGRSGVSRSVGHSFQAGLRDRRRDTDLRRQSSGQTAGSWGSGGGLHRGGGPGPRAGSGAGRPRPRVRVCWRCWFLPGRCARPVAGRPVPGGPCERPPEAPPGPRRSSQAGRRRTFSNQNRKQVESHDVWLNVLEAFNQVHMLQNPPEGIRGHTRGLGPGPTLPSAGHLSQPGAA